MNTFELIRLIILAVGWPVLIIGSIYLFVKGRFVYSMVRGSLVGKITKALVFTMLIEMYSIGILFTAFMYVDGVKGVLFSLPIFVIWYIVFLWCVDVLEKAKAEITKLNNNA